MAESCTTCQFASTYLRDEPCCSCAGGDNYKPKECFTCAEHRRRVAAEALIKYYEDDIINAVEYKRLWLEYNLIKNEAGE